MKLWFDTEFIEDGKTIDLISIGIVREDGPTYYAELVGVDYSRADPWVKDNVLPHLRLDDLKPRAQVACEILAFAGDSPEWWAYYADYDWVVLCQLYGRMTAGRCSVVTSGSSPTGATSTCTASTTQGSTTPSPTLSGRGGPTNSSGRPRAVRSDVPRMCPGPLTGHSTSR